MSRVSAFFGLTSDFVMAVRLLLKALSSEPGRCLAGYLPEKLITTIQDPSVGLVEVRRAGECRLSHIYHSRSVDHTRFC